MDELQSYRRRSGTHSLTPGEAGVIASSTSAPPSRPLRKPRWPEPRARVRGGSAAPVL